MPSTAIVGVDFSTHGDAALRWAADNAPAFDWEVVAVHAWRYPWWAAGPFGGKESDARDEVISSAERHLHRFVAEHLPGGGSTPTMTVVEGDGTEVLMDAAAERDAAAIVVGCSEKGAIAGAVTGSVGRRLASKSPIPVVIVPDSYQHELRPIVVGVDGSDNSVAALRWAAEHRRPGQKVVVVTSWAPDAIHAESLAAIDPELWESGAGRQQREALAAAASQGVDRDDLDVRLVRGDARIVLRDYADGAEALVIGTKGVSGIEGLLMGSVASSLTHSPTCPLVLVPST